MNRTYKFRLYPNKAQAERLDFLLWQGRKIYNGALEMWQTANEVNGCDPSVYDLRDYWCAQRKVEPDTLGLLPFATVDDLIRRLKKAYDNAYKRIERSDFTTRRNGSKNYGFPRFKNRRTFNGLGYRYGEGCKFIPTSDGWAKLRIMNCGDVRVRYHRDLPNDAAIKMLMLARQKNGQWFAALQCEQPDPAIETSTLPAVGIDVGMVFLLALSDGTTIDNPRWYRENKQQRRVLMRKLDRQRRANNPQNYNEDGTPKAGVLTWHTSTRMKETERQLRKLETTIANQRWYFWHTVTDWLTSTYGLIAIEDLTLDFMIQNKRLAMSAHDASFGQFWQMLDYKCAERGVELVRVPPQYTSQTCPECGAVSADNRKTQAQFRCVACGHEENADVNAARNILNAALNGAVQAPRGKIEAKGSKMPCEAPSPAALAKGVEP